MRERRTKSKKPATQNAPRDARARTPSINDRIDDAARRFAESEVLMYLRDGTVLPERRLWHGKPSGPLFEHLERSFERFAGDLSDCKGATRLRRLRRFELMQATRIYELFQSVDRSRERMASVELCELLRRLREGNHLLNVTLPKTPGAVLANAIEILAASGRFDRMQLTVDGQPATRDQLVHYQLLSIATVTAGTDSSYAAQLAADVLDASSGDHRRGLSPDWYWPGAPKFEGGAK
jgi:hypothetical protein